MPLTRKGRKIMAAMKKEYGEKKGSSVFYASANKGTITGVELKHGSFHPVENMEGDAPTTFAQGGAPESLPGGGSRSMEIDCYVYGADWDPSGRVRMNAVEEPDPYGEMDRPGEDYLNEE